MLETPNISEVWITIVYYKGTSGPYKKRPVLVLNHHETSGLYTIAEITSVPPKSPPTFYDQFKEPINDWLNCGLDEPSFIKCANIHNLDRVRLERRIGIMEESDFIHIVNKVIETRSNQKRG
jgi:mRNA interferase MazF